MKCIMNKPLRIRQKKKNSGKRIRNSLKVSVCMCYQSTVSVISKYLGRLEAAPHKNMTMINAEILRKTTQSEYNMHYKET